MYNRGRLLALEVVYLPLSLSLVERLDLGLAEVAVSIPSSMERHNKAVN